jgi:hypothetical protein
MQLSLEAVLETAGLLAFGYLIADILGSRRRWTGATTLALAFPSVVAYALVLMVGHMATGGLVLSRPWVVRAITAAAAIGLAIRKVVNRRSPATWNWRDLIPIGAMVVVALAVWGYPLARILPLASGGDIKWHLGWASQMMNGETTPTNILNGAIPNYYPWLYHALVAFMAAITPGGRAYHVLGPLQLLEVTGAVLALFALGSAVGKHWLAGATVSLFGAVAAGPLLQSSTVVTNPADLGARGTYNASLYNIAPPLPRDVAYVLFVAFLLLVVLGLEERNVGLLFCAGVLLGLIGLTSWEAFFLGVGTAAIIAVVPGAVTRPKRTFALLGPAFALYALWAVPLAMSYARLGGFTNTTAGPPPVLSPLAILLSWGLVIPFAAYAVFRWVPAHRNDPGFWPLFAALVASVSFVVASSAIPRVLGSSFMTLGRAPRYWPTIYLALAILAGLGAAEVLRTLANYRVAIAAVTGAIILALAATVPLTKSWDIPARWRPKPVIAAAMLGKETPIDEVLSTGRAKCTLASPRYVQMTIFTLAGYRQIAYRGADAHAGNYARIRWRDIYRRVPSERERLEDNVILTRGEGSVGRWRRLIQKYGINMVVARRDDFDGPVFRKLFPRQVERLRRDRPRVGLFTVSPCDPS